MLPRKKGKGKRLIKKKVKSQGGTSLQEPEAETQKGEMIISISTGIKEKQ